MHRRIRTSAFVVVLGLLVPGLVGAGDGSATTARLVDDSTGTTAVVSVDAAGDVATAGARQRQPSQFSGPAGAVVDGSGERFVFTTSSPMVGGDTNGVEDVHVHDRAAGTTSRVSEPAAGQTSGASRTPAISRDGTTVAFQSVATELEGGDCRADNDDALGVYARRLSGTAVANATPNAVVPAPGGGTTCVGGPGTFPYVTADGGEVLFASDFGYDAGLVAPPAGSASPTHVLAFDIDAGSWERLTVAWDDPGRPWWQYTGNEAVVGGASDDGRMVAFVSDMHDLTQDTPADVHPYAYVRDRVAGTTTLVSRDDAGAPVRATEVVVSGDGSRAAWVAEASDRGPFVTEVATGDRWPVRQDDGASFGSVSGVSIDDDGSTIAFASSGTAPGVHVWDQIEDVLARVDVLPGDDLVGERPWLSASGRTVAFVGRTPGEPYQLWAHDLETCDGAPLPGAASASARAPKPKVCTNKLVVYGVEVTQGIQNLANGMGLIRGRTTWVRVHARMTSAPAKVRGTLTVTDGTGKVLATLQPKNLGRRASLVVKPDRGTIDESFVFVLPTRLTTGNRIFRFTSPRTTTCVDLGRDCRSSQTFATTVTAHLDLPGQDFNRAGTPVRANLQDAWALLDDVERRLPVSSVNYRHTYNLTVPSLAGNAAPSATLDFIIYGRNVAAAKKAFGCSTGLAASCLVFGMFAGGLQAASGVAAQADPGSGSAVGYARDKVAAHEIGHLLGRKHVNCKGTELGTDSAYPYPGGKLGTTDVATNDTTFWHTDVTDRYLFSFTSRAPTKTGDLMSYCFPKEISDYTYTAIRNAFLTRSAPARTSERAVGPAVLVSATVVGDTVGLAPVRLLEAQPDAAASGELRVVMLDAADAVLATHEVSAEVPLEEGASAGGWFASLFPRPGGLAAVEVRKPDGTVLARRASSANAPTVTLDPIASPLMAGATLDVSWSTGDVDGDDVTVDVLTSVDGGTTWTPFGLDLAGDALGVPVDELPATADGRVRVVASDGFRQATATSGVLVVPGSAPEVMVQRDEDAPAGPIVMEPGQNVELRAFAYDRDEGPLSGTSLTWSSDLAGAVGDGERIDLFAEDLGPGLHQVAVTAQGDDGATAVDSVEVLVRTRVRRLEGGDRIATSVAISTDGFGADEAGAVVLARSDDFADALSGTPLAVAVDGPMLLTPPGALDGRVLDEIRRVLPDGGTVHVLGGEVALSAAVAESVRSAGFAVRRLAGADRYATAVSISDRVESVRPDAGAAPDRVLLADGTNFPDALAAGTGAALVNGVVLLTAGDLLPDATIAALAARPGAEVVAVGGPAARAGATGALDLIGATRIETALLVADLVGDTPVAIGLASARNFPDALSGGAHTARNGGVLLLVEPDVLPAAVADHLGDHEVEVASAWLFGGPVAVQPDVETAVHVALP